MVMAKCLLKVTVNKENITPCIGFVKHSMRLSYKYHNTIMANKKEEQITFVRYVKPSALVTGQVPAREIR